MTLIQEAYSLIQNQSDNNLRIIIDFLKNMSLRKEEGAEATTVTQFFKRTGVAKDLVSLPEDFDEHFDDMNNEISELFQENAAL